MSINKFFKRLVQRKPVELLQQEYHASEYKRKLSAFDLTCMGIGGIIGAGIFVLTGKAAHEDAGPAIIISYVLSGFVCAFACLCYAELGSTLPASGSAYTFTYVSLGQLLAWIVGWDLMLEYLVGAATVAVGWSGHLSSLADSISGHLYTLDPRFVNAPFVFKDADPANGIPYTGFYQNLVQCSDTETCYAIVNIPAILIMVIVTMVVCAGIRETAVFNNAMVIIKLAVILIFVLAGIKFIQPSNYTPFIPPQEPNGAFGWSGIFRASVTVFFSYIGFDSVTTTAQEAKNPQRDLPIGIIASLIVCTILYIAVCAVLTGIQNYTQLNVDAAVGRALQAIGLPAVAVIVDIGAIIGLTSVLLTLIVGQTRIFQSVAYDGLLPSVFSKIHKTTGTPYVSTIICGFVCALLAGLLPVDLLGDLTSAGTLSAFFLVSISTMILRIISPDLPRKFKIPGGFVIGGIIIPLTAALFSAALFSQSKTTQIERVFIWMGIGFIVYLGYGYKHANLPFPDENNGGIDHQPHFDHTNPRDSSNTYHIREDDDQEKGSKLNGKHDNSKFSDLHSKTEMTIAGSLEDI